MGVGMVYANTGHRHMVEVCLKELGKPPGPELENSVDRESYSLTAGLALGLIAMGLRALAPLAWVPTGVLMDLARCCYYEDLTRGVTREYTLYFHTNIFEVYESHHMSYTYMKENIVKLLAKAKRLTL